MRIIPFVILFAMLVVPAALSVESEDTEHDIVFFYSTTCPHCKKEITYLKNLEQEYPQIHIKYMEFTANYELFQEYAKRFNTSSNGVPKTFVGDKVFLGFTPENGDLDYNPSVHAYIGYQNQIEKAILNHFSISSNPDTSQTESSSNWFWLLAIMPLYLLFFPFIRKRLRERHWTRYYFSIFFVILIFLSFVLVVTTSVSTIKGFAEGLPFPLFVSIIALADGFNPCAFTVLIILLSLLTYTQDKRSMLTIGLTFIFTSSIMYFIFIMVLLFAGSWALELYGPMVLAALAVILIIAGIINIKDFFFLKKGPSLGISDNNKKRFSHHAKKITDRLRESKTLTSMIIAIFATFILAIFVNIVELGCTAILPVIFMASLFNSFGTTISTMHYFWTAIYSLIYVLPLLAILSSFIFTFKSTRLTENQGRILKLVSGIFMIIFGIILIFFPEFLMFA